MPALAYRGCEDPAGRDGPGLGEQQTLFGGEGAGKWAGTGHLGNRSEGQTPPESVMRGRTVKKGWRAPVPPLSYRLPCNSHPTSLNTLALHITFAGAGSGLTVLASPGRTQPPQYDVVLKRVPALPPGPAWECELSLARAPAQGCGFVWSLSFNSKKEGPCLASFPSPGFLCVLLNIPEISCH